MKYPLKKLTLHCGNVRSRAKLKTLNLHNHNVYGHQTGWWQRARSSGNYMFKVNNINTRTRCGICPKLTIAKPERCHCLFSHFLFFFFLRFNFLRSNFFKVCLPRLKKICPKKRFPDCPKKDSQQITFLNQTSFALSINCYQY